MPQRKSTSGNGAAKEQGPALEGILNGRGPEAREKLAKVSGILLAYPNLKLQVEGYTDNIGSDEYNQKLSEQRADSVRDGIEVVIAMAIEPSRKRLHPPLR